MMVRDDEVLSLDRSCSRFLSCLWRSVTLRTEKERNNLMCRNTDGLQSQMGLFLTQPGISLILLPQLIHIILKLRLLGQEILLELLEEQQRSDER